MKTPYDNLRLRDKGISEICRFLPHVMAFLNPKVVRRIESLPLPYSLLHPLRTLCTACLPTERLPHSLPPYLQLRTCTSQNPQPPNCTQPTKEITLDLRSKKTRFTCNPGFRVQNWRVFKFKSLNYFNTTLFQKPKRAKPAGSKGKDTCYNV